jgi:hypothetical protein
VTHVLLVCAFPDPKVDLNFANNSDIPRMREAMRGLCVACTMRRHQLVITENSGMLEHVRPWLDADPMVLNKAEDFAEYPEPRRAVFIGGMQPEVDTFHRLRELGIASLPTPETGLATLRMYYHMQKELSPSVQRLLNDPQSYAVLFEALLSV